MKKLSYLTLLTAMLLPMVISAQWSSDPMMNTPLDTSSGSQTIPKTALRLSDNSMYVSYFSNASGNNDLMLQRLTHDGIPLWPAPVIVSHNTQEETLYDYSCCTDNDENCVIAFSDSRGGTLDIYVYKISAGGEPLWGENGIRLSHHPEWEFKPALCVTSDNTAVVAWTEMDAFSGDHLVMAAVEEDGSLPWGLSNINWAPDGEYSYLLPSLVATESGNFIVVYSKASGPPWSVTRYIYAQRLDLHGNLKWDQEAPVSALAGPPAWDNFNLKEDGQGGFFIAWHEDREQDKIMESYVQHVDPDGNFRFPDNGLKVGDRPMSHKYYPVVAGQNAANEIFVFWVQMNYEVMMKDAKGDESLWGQRIAADGTLLWSEEGTEIIPTGDFYILSDCDLQDNISYIFYNTIGNDPEDIRIRACSVDDKGNPAWESDYLSISEVPRQVIAPVLSDFADGQWVMFWSDSRVPTLDLYAQNINQDGTIGIPTGIVDPDPRKVSVYPNPCHDRFHIYQEKYNRIGLSDLSGRIIYDKEIKAGTSSFDISSLTPGIYILSLSGPDGQLSRKLAIR